MRIVFMGTPDFAVGSLRKLVESGNQIVGVVTVPDKPSGRGRKTRQSPVKEYALSQGLTVFQPAKLKNSEWLTELEALEPDLIVVVAFRMLPEVVWKMPSKGTINLHASLLPQYRGAAPINWAIINGETKTGVTTFFINENIDTGAIIEKAEVTIADDDNAGSLHDKLLITGAELLSNTVNLIENGDLVSKPQQPQEEVKHAPKIFKDDTWIDFTKSTKEVYNFIRGLSPYPCSLCHLIMDEEQYDLKIFDTVIDKDVDFFGKPGSISTDNKKWLKVSCKDGVLIVKTLQLAGKKRMNTHEFLNGFKLSDSARMA